MPKSKRNTKTRIELALSRIPGFLRNRWLRIRAKLNRNTFANVFMLCFIIFSGVGAGMIFLPAGLVVAGAACGIFGYLLGAE